jgi:hypothetical protein
MVMAMAKEMVIMVLVHTRGGCCGSGDDDGNNGDDVKYMD